MSLSISDLAKGVSRVAGHGAAFFVALAVVIVWGISGPLFAYSDTWQLVINTGTTVVTFLMVFLIQKEQNRSSAAIQLQISELIRATKNANNWFASLEDVPEERLSLLARRFAAIAHGSTRQSGEVEANDTLVGARGNDGNG